MYLEMLTRYEAQPQPERASRSRRCPDLHGVDAIFNRPDWLEYINAKFPWYWVENVQSIH